MRKVLVLNYRIERSLFKEEEAGWFKECFLGI